MTTRSCYAGVCSGALAHSVARIVKYALFASVLVFATVSGARAAVLSEDPGDQTYLTIAINEALETRKTEIEVPLRNPDTGTHGTLVIERTYYRDPTTPCRDYRRTVERAGAPPSEVHGTGCRIGKALWSLDEVSVPPAARPSASGRSDAPLPLSPRPASPATKSGGSGGPAPAATAGGAAPGSRAPANEVPPPPSFPGYTMPSRANL